MRPCIPDNLNFITREFGNYPLGKGFLTGKMDDDTKRGTDDFRSTLPRLTPEALKANQALMDLREIDHAASEIDEQGARYPEKLEAMTGT